MSKILKKIFIMTWLFLAFFGNTFAENTDLLKKIKNNDEEGKELLVWWNINNTIIEITNSIIDIVLAICIVYFFIIVIKLIFSENWEEESWNFKKWFIWISIWIIVIQMAKLFVYSIVSKETIEKSSSSSLWEISNTLLLEIVQPLTRLIETWASFIFILIWIYAFFKLISTNWDEEKAKKWKMMIFYSIIWFIIIKLAAPLISAVYWKCEKTKTDNIIWVWKCEHTTNISWVSGIITNIINWINSFVWIWVIIMIIYIWLQIIFSNGDEEKLKSWKKSLFFIVIWIWILVMNYLILIFFLR